MPMENGKIGGVRIPKPLNRLTKNFVRNKRRKRDKCSVRVKPTREIIAFATDGFSLPYLRIDLNSHAISSRPNLNAI